MRTRWEIVLPVPSGANPFAIRACGEAALDEIANAETWLSAFRPDSDLFHLNHAAQSGNPVRVPGPLFAFLVRVQELVRATKGAFDPAVGSLIALRDAAKQSEIAPTSSEIAAYQRLANWEQNVFLDADVQTVRFARAGVRLNMGAVGKGWALDKAVESLRENGITSALLHGGTSSVYGLGVPPQTETGWPVGLQNPPEAEGAEVWRVVHLCNAALGVSAQKQRHILNARTGTPIENTRLAAVLCASAMEADALSTALLVLGSGDALLRARFPHAAFIV